jgi:hypothetical protein
MEIRVYDSFSFLPETIVKQCSYPKVTDFLLSLNWFSCVYDTVLSNDFTPRLYFALSPQEDVLGFLFCCAPRTKRQLSGLTSFYSLYFSPVSLSSTLPLDVLMEAIGEFISKEMPRWTSIKLRYIPHEAMRDAAIPGALRRHGFFVSDYLMYDNWFLDLNGRDFHTYFSSRPSRLRNTVIRKERKLRKSHSYEIKLYTRSDSRLEQATREYTEIYNHSWKHSEPYPRFIPELISVASALGVLRLGVLYVDGTASAAQLWLTAPNRKATIYKLAYKEEFSALSVGSILSYEMFKHAIDVDKVTQIDYGVGSENYKKDWMESVRPIVGMEAQNLRTVEGAASSVIEYAKGIARRIKRRSSFQGDPGAAVSE